MTADFADMMQAAAARTRSQDWEAAATSYADAAHAAGMRGQVPQAWSAWRAAGECWRRADRPRDAERCLRRALELTEPDGEAAAATGPLVAAALSDLGHVEMAEDLLESIAGEQGVRRLPAAFVDTRAGLLLQLGRKEAARVMVSSFRPADDREAQALQFRQGLLQALDGELDAATRTWRTLVVALHDAADGQAGLAMALMGLAEAELLAGAGRRALEHFEAAVDAGRQAGRKALVWQAEAGRIRAMVALGVTPMPGLLDGAVRWAEERALLPLRVRLRMARGLARCDREPHLAGEDLDDAMAEAMQTGQPLLVGRAAYERAVRLPGSDASRTALLETAAMAVVSHVPLAARVALARARLLARTDARQARAIARSTLPGLERMGLRREARLARRLLEQLGG